MLRDFNLLVTTRRGKEADVCSEMWYLLGEIGDSSAHVDKTGILGLIAAKSSFPPLESVARLRDMLKERPHDFHYSLRIIPIQRVVNTEKGAIERAATQLSEKIAATETFRVTVEKRHSQLHTREIIESAAAGINRKVDLANPQKIVLVEVVGGVTGISVIEPSDVMSVPKEKSAVEMI